MLNTYPLPRIKMVGMRTLLLICLLLSGCSVTKTVPKGDALFTGFEVKVEGKNDSSNRGKQLQAELGAAVRPEPNASILGLRPKLAIYNTFYTEKEKGLKHWIMTKLGEPPVLVSQVDTGSVSTVMSNRLHNRGYFNNQVSSVTEVDTAKKTATINWTARVGEPYRLRNIKYTLNDSLAIHQAIRQTQPESVLKTGEPYDLGLMTDERLRIDGELKNKGYYYFSPDMLIFSVDTTVGNRQADVLMRVKKVTPSPALQPYTLDDIYIFANYFIGDSMAVNDTISILGYHYIPNEEYLKAKHLLDGVFLAQDSTYTRENHLLTIKRLSGLAAYKFVNIDYSPDTLNPGKLDAFIYLTPAMKKSLRAEAQMVTKSNNFAGPGLKVSFQNRNAFRGSEVLSVEFTGSFESQVGGRGTGTVPEGVEAPKKSGIPSYELGVQTTLAIPRIVSPFNLRNLRTEFVPQTRIGLGFNFLSRSDFYTLNSYNATYGYTWRPKETLTFDATPINLQYVRLVDTTAAFNEILEANPYLSSSFENQFIIGGIYQMTYSNQMFKDRTSNIFNKLTLDLSGNVVSGFQSLLGKPKPTPEEPRVLYKDRFAQYLMVDNDFRHYLNLGTESQLVWRLATGVGYSYGNSRTMPYVKQFSVGGPNSVRAFRARSVGPGTYDVPDSVAFSFFDQVGDIRLETNLEYRFPIVGFFKGAVFADAGNIWNLRETDKEGAKFEAKNFLSELAVGTGVGLRIDVEFFVIRLDLGIPVRVPYLPKGDRFVLNKFNGSFSGDYGMVLNIAIGYPF